MPHPSVQRNDLEPPLADAEPRFEPKRAAWLSVAAELPRRARELWATPLGKVLALALVVRLAGPFWGLPNADGWDDDGVAPRDFLPGVLQTYVPGEHYTYPPLHLILLAIASSPVWIARLIRAPDLTPAAVVSTFINVPTVAALAVVARLVSACLSLGLLWNVAKIGQDLRGGARAGVWVAAACALNATFTYYSQTTNLDGPYLFWGVWSLRWLVYAVVHEKPSALRRSLVLAALSVATKDQAYALFILTVPATLAAWLLFDRGARARWPAIAKEAAIGVGLALPLLLLVDGAITNPAGFRDRIGFLLGTASQDHAYYAPSWEGRVNLLRDLARQFDKFYPLVFAPIAALGLAVAVGARGSLDRRRRVAGLVPLLCALSFTIAFDMTARRTENRFILPQSMMLGIYVGLALDATQTWLAGRAAGARAATWAFAALVTGLFGLALFGCLAVDAAMFLDPRYEAEAWMAEHLRPGDRVEVYDNNVHLPRFPAKAMVERVDTTPVAARNPLLGVEEVSDRFSNVEARRPDYILVSEFWAGKYLVEPAVLEGLGLVPSPSQLAFVRDTDSRAYFHALLDGNLNYRRAHVSGWTSTFWPRVDLHASLTRAVWIFERKPGT
jgi:hypothetical protein